VIGDLYCGLSQRLFLGGGGETREVLGRHIHVLVDHWQVTGALARAAARCARTEVAVGLVVHSP